MNFLPVYIRLVAYAIVFVSSFTHLIMGCNHSVIRVVYAGNMVVAALLAIAALEQDLFNISGVHIRNTIVTPAIIIWAIFHLISLHRIKCHE